MRRLTVLALLLVALLTACGTSTDSGAATDPGEAGATPHTLEFTATTAAGASFDATSLAGKPVVFWFWAPWCPTCRAQAPGVQRLAATYGDKVNIVGVGSLDQEEAIRGFAEAVPEVTQLVDPDGSVWRHFGVTAQSTYLVLDVYGSTIASGYLDDDDLADVVDQLAG